MKLRSNSQSWKKMFSHVMILVLMTSVAHAAKYKPPVVEDEEPVEAVPDIPEEEPVLPPKKVKNKDGRITLVVPTLNQLASEKKEITKQPAAPEKPKAGCVRTLKEYNDPNNKFIKDAVGGKELFTTWFDQSYPVSITINPNGGAVVSAPGFDKNPRDVALCVDAQGPILKFDGHSIRLRRGPLKNIAFEFNGYKLNFMTQRPNSGRDTQQVFDSVN